MREREIRANRSASRAPQTIDTASRRIRRDAMARSEIPDVGGAAHPARAAQRDETDVTHAAQLRGSPCRHRAQAMLERNARRKAERAAAREISARQCSGSPGVCTPSNSTGIATLQRVCDAARELRHRGLAAGGEVVNLAFARRLRARAARAHERCPRRG